MADRRPSLSPRGPAQKREKRARDRKEWDRITGTRPGQYPPPTVWPGGQGDTYPGSMGGGSQPTNPPQQFPPGSPESTFGAGKNLLDSLLQAKMASDYPWELYKLGIHNLNPPGRFFPNRNINPENIYQHLADRLGLHPNPDPSKTGLDKLIEQGRHIWPEATDPQHGYPQGNIPRGLGDVLTNIGEGVRNHPLYRVGDALFPPTYNYPPGTGHWPGHPVGDPVLSADAVAEELPSPYPGMTPTPPYTPQPQPPPYQPPRYQPPGPTPPYTPPPPPGLPSFLPTPPSPY